MSPVKQVEGSGAQEHSEFFHSWSFSNAIFGCAICPGWCVEKSRPLGPCAASGENTAWKFCACELLKPCGE